MSFAGRAENSNGCVIKPREHGIGLRSCFVQIQSSSLTGSYVMEMAEQREPYESRGSRTVLGEPGGESPPGHSTIAAVRGCQALPLPSFNCRPKRGMLPLRPGAARRLATIRRQPVCAAIDDHGGCP